MLEFAAENKTVASLQCCQREEMCGFCFGVLLAEMVAQCGRCGGWFEPTRGGWSGKYVSRLHYPGLRCGVQSGDPLHDKCYQTIYRLMVRLNFGFQCVLTCLPIARHVQCTASEQEEAQACRPQRSAVAVTRPAARETRATSTRTGTRRTRRRRTPLRRTVGAPLQRRTEQPHHHAARHCSRA